MALDVSAIVGIILMSVGTLMVAWGLVLCYTTKVRILFMAPSIRSSKAFKC